VKHRLAKLVIAVTAVVTFTLVGAIPASAGGGIYGCPGGGGKFSIGVNRTTATIGVDTACATTVQVRIRYALPIGVTAYTAWKSSTTSATVTAPSGGNVLSADFRIGTTAMNGVKP
jgi:hypothetical protein